MRFSQYQEEEVGISLTPLIDVVFLLLIFFMVSTTFSKESQLNLRLPTSDLPLDCLLYTSPSPRDGLLSRMPSSA